MKEAEELLQKWKRKDDLHWLPKPKRIKRNVLPSTDYVMELFVCLDYYLYRTYVHVHIHVHVHVHIHIHIHLHVQIHIHVHVHVDDDQIPFLSI